MNESTVRTIRDNKEKILKSTAGLRLHAHLSKIVRNPNIVNMEEMLMVWILEFVEKKIPIDTRSIRIQESDFYEYFEKKS